MGVYDNYLQNIYGEHFRKDDPLNIKICQIGDFRIGGWPFSHFYMYLILTLIKPQWWFLYMGLGIGWELVEFYFGFNTLKFTDESDEKIYCKMFYGNNFDPISNAAGIVCGLLIYSVLNSINLNTEDLIAK